jgi:hypothetical protein
VYATIMLSMKKIVWNALIVIVLLSSISVGTVEAHPGRTDANGGHTCRTNCASWGLSQGEYHYHGGGSSSGGSSGESSYTAPVQEVVELPTNTPVPIRLPTSVPTRVPTKIPTATVTVAASPTATLTKTATKALTLPQPIPVKATGQDLNLIERVVDFFQKIFRFQ